jgi:hypothetical protein
MILMILQLAGNTVIRIRIYTGLMHALLQACKSINSMLRIFIIILLAI